MRQTADQMNVWEKQKIADYLEDSTIKKKVSISQEGLCQLVKSSLS